MSEPDILQTFGIFDHYLPTEADIDFILDKLGEEGRKEYRTKLWCKDDKKLRDKLINVYVKGKS